MKLYRDFEDQSEIDAQYDVLGVVDDAGALLAEHLAVSAATRAGFTSARLDVAYGPTLDEYLDVFPASVPGAPVLVFFHGGWWSVPISGPDHALCATGPVAHGVTVVVVNYSLAPKVSLDEIVRQARAAVAWVHRNIEDHGGDPDRIFVAGHSAGGQIVGMLALTDWQGEYGLPLGSVKGAVALSGLFDLEVFRYSWLAPKLLLSAETVRRQSPLRNIRSSPVELLVALGADESQAFHEQSEVFAEAWLAAGNTGRHLSISGHTHLSVYATYADPDSELTVATVELIERQT